jgi:hypothetical protein
MYMIGIPVVFLLLFVLAFGGTLGGPAGRWRHRRRSDLRRSRHHLPCHRQRRAKSVERASNLPMPLILLPFLASGFVSTESMSERAAVVCSVPALHTVHRDAPGIPARDADGHERLALDRLVPCRSRRLVMVAVPQRPPIAALNVLGSRVTVPRWMGG